MGIRKSVRRRGQLAKGLYLLADVRAGVLAAPFVIMASETAYPPYADGPI
jgi:hypothetical protein